MKQRIDYVLNQFHKVYNIPFKINVGYSTNSKIEVRKGETNFFEYAKPFPEHDPVWEVVLDKKIPFFFDEKQKEILTKKENGVVLNYDVISNAFYFLSGWQEIFCEQKDDLGRFPFAQSIQKKYDFVEVPVVNYYFELLKQSIELAYETKIELKNKSTFFLTHDIDKINSGWLEGGFSEFKKGKILSSAKLGLKKIAGKDAWNNLIEIANLEEEMNVKSAFYFLPEKGMNEGVLNADYELKEVKNDIKELRERGFEIGIHGSYGTAINKESFKAQLSKLNFQFAGGRFHFLHFDIENTPEIIDEVGLKYDSTLGFAEVPGFRFGICNPFNLYNLKEEKPYIFLEYPLNLMDTTFQQSKYLHATKEDVIRVAEKLQVEIQKFGGVFTVLWHNNFFSDYKYSGWREVYVDLVKMLQKDSICLISEKQL